MSFARWSRVTPVVALLSAPVGSAVAGCASPPSDVPAPRSAGIEPVAPRPTPTEAVAAPEVAKPAARPEPSSAAECVAMVGTDAARSDATVTPEVGSGKSERFAGIVAAIKRERGAMRCCYDLWAKDNPRDAGLTLAFAIDQSGAITGVQIKGDSGDPFAVEAGGCIVDVALGIRYPASPGGMTTTFEYDLGFRHHVAPSP